MIGAGAALCATALAVSDASAQAVARGASEAFYSTGASPACGAGVSLRTSAEYRAASVVLLPAPVTSFTGKGLGAPVVAGSLSTPEHHAWQVQAGGAVGHAVAECAGFSGYNRLWGAARYQFGRNGVLLSAGARSLSPLDPSQNRAGVTIGVWHDLRRVRVSFDVRRDAQASQGWNRFTRFDTTRSSLTSNTSTSDTTKFTRDTLLIKSRQDSTARRVEWPTTSLRTRLQWNVGRLALDFTLGGTSSSAVGNLDDGLRADTGGSFANSASRRRSNVRLWGRADARVALNSFMEAVGGFASLPAGEINAMPARRVGMLGFAINGIPRVSRAPDAASHEAKHRESAATEAFESVRDDAETIRLRVRLPRASSVELSSELTGWTAVPMQRSGSDWWELPVHSPAGVYRVNIRVDGGTWTAPPNVSTVRDEFGGQVGIVKIG